MQKENNLTPNPQLSCHFKDASALTPSLVTELGVLFNADCVGVLKNLKDETINTIFADPPFNLKKDYGKTKSGTLINDNLSEDNYTTWCETWMQESIRILKEGGSFFLYNIPAWNIKLAPILERMGLEFRHWIAISMKCSLPIANKLYPAHYSLLYFTKGKPKTFNKVRTPIELCRHCGKEIKDYGGHKSALHPDGISLTDVWTDISPVRHSKYKSENREANQLSTKILSRIINLSTNSGDIVLDPFGGSGTTFDVCEDLHRKWIGIELGSCDAIIERLTTDRVKSHQIQDKVEVKCAKSR